MATLSVLPGAVPELTPDLLDRYAPLYQRVREVIPELEWQTHLPWIDAIQRLKKQRNAVILAHNYQAPEIFHTVADITGDSLALAQQAARADARVLVQCGVHFMAETSKILCPDKTVLIPDTEAGCSLAESITAQDVRLLKAKYPGVPVVTYVNTSADVKAESDVCCTSANAVHIVESLGVDKVIFLPDKYLGQYVASRTQVKVVLWEGACEVHERFSGEELRSYRRAHGNVRILAHPECPPDVLLEADFVGSTAAMVTHLAERRPRRVVMITECSMSDNVAVQFPEIEFTRPCNLCPHMRRITLPRIHDALLHMRHEVQVDAAIAARARRAVERMLAIGRKEAA
ncbi:quinolinate synthase NadA [Tahibacter caeni]|uniref:quinolinate synthase NadA n=1 Tax=Tahibacter caeni TaxID=1453545 RepID=UPI0021493650|nr:quinolinate synthase NadA [Tahibacter caeni]